MARGLFPLFAYNAAMDICIHVFVWGDIFMGRYLGEDSLDHSLDLSPGLSDPKT